MAVLTRSRPSFLKLRTAKRQPKLHRIVLLVVLAYEALGCLAGGSMLIAAPDGHLMKMPVEIMHGAFVDFYVPGTILFALGILNTSAFFSVLRRDAIDWIMATLAIGGLLIWFWVEIAILGALHWLHAMWGLPVVLAGFACISLFPPNVLRKGALTSGILASLLYVGINIIVPARWPAYNVITQTVSELSAIGAPTRVLWTVLATPYTILSIAFAIGVWKQSGSNQRLRMAGIFLIVYGALGVLWPFASMHQRSTLAAGGGTFSDTMHLILAGITQGIYLIALGLAAAALSKPFRWYSICTLLLLFFFGALTFIEAPNVSKNLPTPYIGLWERINIGLFLLWVIVLAVSLLRSIHSAADEDTAIVAL